MSAEWVELARSVLDPSAYYQKKLEELRDFAEGRFKRIQNGPECPECFWYLWEWFLALAPMPTEVSPYQHIATWAQLTQVEVAPGEVEILVQLHMLRISTKPLKGKMVSTRDAKGIAALFDEIGKK